MTSYPLTELHRHLDVSLRLGTLLSLAQERGLEPTSTSLAHFQDKFVLRKPLPGLGEVLGQFSLFQKVLDRPEVLERVAFEVSEDCYLEGIRKAELRFSPSFVCDVSRLPWDEALAAFGAGLKRAQTKYPDFQAGLICIGSRDFGMDSILQTVEFFLRNTDRFIGIDLAGDESTHPNSEYVRAFKPVVDSGANITVHAGEAAGPDSMWAALEMLGAKRIGHGITCVQDRQLMDTLRDRKICLEMCPTSNFITSAVPDLRKHPLKEVLHYGIPVCINTDDPGIFGADLPHEIEVCRREMGMSEADIHACFAHAEKYSFLS